MSDQDAGGPESGEQALDEGRRDERPGWVHGDGGRVPSWLATASAWAWRLLLLVAAATAVLIVLTRLYLVTLPIIVALILATLLVPPARALERRRLPPMVAASVVVVGGVALVSGIVAALVPVFVQEVGQLVETVQEGFDQLLVFLDDTFGWGQQEVSDLIDQALALLQQQSGQIAQQALTGAAIAVQAVAALVLALVLLFFFIKDGEQIVGWIADRTPAAYRDTMRAVGRRAWTALTGFIRGTAAIALMDAIGIGVGLAILRVPAALPIAVLVFLGGFVPVIGAFLTGLLAVLVALADGGLQVALIVLAIVVGVQQIESNVFQPVIMRRAVALHPMVILAALTAGATLLGVIGAFLAVPVAAVLSAVANELRLRHEASMIAQPPETADEIDQSTPLSGPPDNARERAALWVPRGRWRRASSRARPDDDPDLPAGTASGPAEHEPPG